MKQARNILRAATLLALATAPGWGQNSSPNPAPLPSQMTETGHVASGGRSVPFLIRRLPVSSYPDLPADVAETLNQRGCMIPQTYEAHHPENVVRASLERAGSSDWAVLCATRGTVSLLIFFASAPEEPIVLASAQEMDRLQAHGPSGVLGFNWGIDPASPEQVREARSGMEHRPPPTDHDALADSIIDIKTIYHFYSKHTWTLLDVPG
jgi:hypothetical protein